MRANFSPLSGSRRMPSMQSSVSAQTEASKMKVESTDPPLNSPSSKRSSVQELRLALATLNVTTVSKLADYLEALDGKGKLNDRYGLYGVWKIANLDLNSPYWNELEIGKWNYWRDTDMDSIWLDIRPEYRQMIKKMACRILDTKYKFLMNDVHGGDGIFDPGELSDWLSKNKRNGKEPDSIAFHNFLRSVVLLNDKAVGIMDWLEWHDNPQKADPDNRRFGMRGVQLLSRLTPDSKEWEEFCNSYIEEFCNPHIDDTLRQKIINAAKVLMNPDYVLWQFQVHQGDQIFETDDMQNWIDSQIKI